MGLLEGADDTEGAALVVGEVVGRLVGGRVGIAVGLFVGDLDGLAVVGNVLGLSVGINVVSSEKAKSVKSSILVTIVSLTISWSKSTIWMRVLRSIPPPSVATSTTQKSEGASGLIDPNPLN